MPAASIPLATNPARASSFAQARPSLRNRAGGLAFSLAMVVFTFLVMWRMGAISLADDRKTPALVAINLPPPPPPQPAAGSAPKKPAVKVAPVEPQQPRVLPPPLIKPKVTVPALVQVSHANMAAWDISKLKKGDASGGAGGAGNGKLYGPGEAAGVGKLYNAEWYREPTRAELATYLPQGLHGTSWGMIACRTVEAYHVENCQELDESPPGSGLARALRRASWQLLVRPPRIDGKPLIGAWVRIKFTFNAAKSEAEQAQDIPGG